MNQRILIETWSVCIECCKEIPATIVERADAVFMVKTCSEHGPSEAMIERDTKLYRLLRGSEAGIYEGHFIDVTTRCNLDCPYCYFPCRTTQDPSIERIVQEAHCTRGPYHLTGGEPTLRADLPDLFRLLQPLGGAAMPTNGIGLVDRGYLAECLKYVGRYNDVVARISLSFHETLNAKAFAKVIENLRAVGDKIAGTTFVIQSLDEIPGIIATARALADCIDCTRIHVATEVWNCQDRHQLFLSDLLKWFQSHAQATGKRLDWFPESSKTMWAPVRFDGLKFALARWNTKHDIDLANVGGLAPTYRAYNGAVVHLLEGFIINEAWQRGWCKGRRLSESVAKPAVQP